MSTITIQKENATEAYNLALQGKPLTQILTVLFKGENISNMKITDRVKFFEDACMIMGEDPEDDKFNIGDPDDIAYQKLKVIIKALNEGKIPTVRYVPYFRIDSPGFRFDGAGYGYDSSLSSSTVGSRLCLCSPELATYAGIQFLPLYKDLLN